MESNVGVGGIVPNEDKLISSEFNVFKKPQYYKDIIKTITLLLRPQNLGGHSGIPLHFEVHACMHVLFIFRVIINFFIIK